MKGEEEKEKAEQEIEFPSMSFDEGEEEKENAEQEIAGGRDNIGEFEESRDSPSTHIILDELFSKTTISGSTSLRQLSSEAKEKQAVNPSIQLPAHSQNLLEVLPTRTLVAASTEGRVIGHSDTHSQSRA